MKTYKDYKGDFVIEDEDFCCSSMKSFYAEDGAYVKENIWDKTFSLVFLESDDFSLDFCPFCGQKIEVGFNPRGMRQVLEEALKDKEEILKFKKQSLLNAEKALENVKAELEKLDNTI
jgi:hypothetical protein